MAIAVTQVTEAESTLEKLEQLLSSLNNFCTETARISSEIDREGNEIQQSSEALTNTSITLYQSLTENYHQVEESGTEAIATLDSLAQLASEVQSKLDESHQAIATQKEQFESETGDRCSDLEKGWDQALGTFKQTDETLDEFEETLTQLADKTEQTFSELEDEIQQWKDQTHDFQTSVEADFDDLKTDLTNTHTTAVQSGFNAFSTELVQEQLNELSTSCSNLNADFSKLADNFTTQFEALGDELTQRSTEIIQNVGNHLTTQAEATIKEAISGLIEDAIVALLDEVIESTVMMTAGAATTTALAPILPQLKAAKMALQAINDVLDFIF
jgi:ABC-type transporter Mla subunit MlaD